MSTVQQQLVSPVVRSLKNIVDILKPKNYGIRRRNTERTRSLPPATKQSKVTVDEDAILSPQIAKNQRFRSPEAV